ncbi:zinc-binding dehydrogenase [Nonomuraea sp. NPDC050153]|uniref:zinc-binding dehydrogenase n=1 Tax=Nonomuraea sp. NPDC050153 TaxID=3364359 RepID=UPI0037B2BE96
MVVPMPAGRVEVIATAAGEDERYVRTLGAVSSFDYLTADVAEESLRRHPGGVDAIVNLALRGEPLIAAARAIRPGGRLLSTTPGTPEQSAFGREDLSVTVVMGALKVHDHTLRAIAAYLLDGTLPDPISRRYRFADAVRSYQDFVGMRHRGKFVVSMGGGACLMMRAAECDADELNVRAISKLDPKQGRRSSASTAPA